MISAVPGCSWSCNNKTKTTEPERICSYDETLMHYEEGCMGSQSNFNALCCKSK